jgi:hypothetical protein
LIAEAKQTVEVARGPQHPDPLSAPEDFRLAEGVSDLYYRWEAAWGGAMLLGTETIAVVLFNGGYSLEDVVLRIRGLAASGSEVFSKEETVPVLPRGREVTVEVPSYEVLAPVSDLAVSVASGRLAAGM